MPRVPPSRPSQASGSGMQRAPPGRKRPRWRAGILKVVDPTTPAKPLHRLTKKSGDAQAARKTAEASQDIEDNIPLVQLALQHKASLKAVTSSSKQSQSAVAAAAAADDDIAVGSTAEAKNKRATEARAQTERKRVKDSSCTEAGKTRTEAKDKKALETPAKTDRKYVMKSSHIEDSEHKAKAEGKQATAPQEEGKRKYIPGASGIEIDRKRAEARDEQETDAQAKDEQKHLEESSDTEESKHNNSKQIKKELKKQRKLEKKQKKAEKKASKKAEKKEKKERHGKREELAIDTALADLAKTSTDGSAKRQKIENDDEPLVSLLQEYYPNASVKVEGASTAPVIAEATVAIAKVAIQPASVEPILVVSRVAAQPVSVEPACALTAAESNNVAAAVTPPLEWANPRMPSAGAPVSEATNETPPFSSHEEGTEDMWVREQKQGAPVTPPLASDPDDDSWGTWRQEQKQVTPVTPPLINDDEEDSWGKWGQEQKQGTPATPPLVRQYKNEQKQRAPVTPPKKESWDDNSWRSVGENSSWDWRQGGQEEWSGERGTRWKEDHRGQEASWPSSSRQAQRHEDSWKKPWGQQGQTSTAWKRNERGYDSRHEANEAWSKGNQWWKDRNNGGKTRPARSEHKSWKSKDEDEESAQTTTALVPWREAETQARLHAVESEKQLAEAEKNALQQQLAEKQAHLEALESQKQLAETEKQLAEAEKSVLQQQLAEKQARLEAQIESTACLPPLCAEAMPPNQAPFPIFGRHGWHLANNYPDRDPNGGHAIADHACMSGGQESQAPALPSNQLGFGACLLQPMQLTSLPQQLLPDVAHGLGLDGPTHPDLRYDRQQVSAGSGFASCSSQSQPHVQLSPEHELPSRPSALLDSQAQQRPNFGAESEIDGVLPQKHSLARDEQLPGPTQRPKKPLPGPGGVLSRVSQR